MANCIDPRYYDYEADCYRYGMMEYLKGKNMAKGFNETTMLPPQGHGYAPNSKEKINGPDNTKQTNPKDAVGIAKVPMSCVPAQVLAELGLAMMEGALKYGRSNYRIAGVRGSVYYDAANRHLMSWYEGEDIDPDSGLSHITKAIASLTVLRDSMMQNNWVDDRPPATSNKSWIVELNKKAKELLEKYPNPKKAFTNKDT